MTDVAGAWATVSGAVGEELAAWQRAHPVATLAEIEATVEATTQRLRQALVTALAQGEAAAVEGRPACPRCRTAMERRGTKRREVLAARQAAPVRLTRAYFVCPACHAGLFPPG